MDPLNKIYVKVGHLMPQSPFERITYTVILLTFLVLGALFAFRVPDWQAPDEPAHYNYVAQVVEGDLLPIIEMGDWNNDYLETLKANDFVPDLLDGFNTIQYENHQPPLYYWLAAPFFLLSNGSLEMIRLYSVLLGAMAVALTFAVAKEVFPERSEIALGAMALFAFLPQNAHILASVNNDALADMMIAILLLLCVRYLNGKNAPLCLIGLAMGITFITKTTAYFMAGVVLIVIFMGWRQSEERDWLSLLKSYLRFAIPAGIFALLYWGRNIATYGFPDFLGLKAHDTIVVGQLRTADYIADIGRSEYWKTAFETTFNSFWGKFGWMEANLGDALPFAIWSIVFLMILAMTGLIFYAIRRDDAEKPSLTIWITLGLVLFLALMQFVYYNLTFVQFQGRYIFAGLLPFTIAMVLGIDKWRKQFFRRWSWLTIAIFLLFVPLDLYLIWRVIPAAVGIP
jgi:4-amino-4-deoxy-L-arabinose transferase-like glycosyltransferase